MPLSLSDDELMAIMDAARPIDPRERDQFLRGVDLRKCSIAIGDRDVLHPLG